MNLCENRILLKILEVSDRGSCIELERFRGILVRTLDGTWTVLREDIHVFPQEHWGTVLNLGNEVKTSLRLINYAPRCEDIRRSGGIALPLLTSAVVEGESSASRPGLFTPVEVRVG